MTSQSTVDMVRAFTAELPRNITSRFRLDQVSAGMVHAAIRDHGWTPAQLARYVTRDLAGVVNPAPRVLERLRHAAGNPPSSQPAGPVRLPLCDECEDGYIVDAQTRLPIRRCKCRTTTTTMGAAD